jgi:EPS-associated MarR family transcriptional regulator
MDESHFKALMEMARNGHISQRELSAKVGLSLGRVNFIVNSLIEKGYVKARRFRNSNNKMAYMYILTPSGLRKKVDVMRSFMTEKTKEYERLKWEVEELRFELESLTEPEQAGNLELGDLE